MEQENFPDLTVEQIDKLYDSGKDITIGFIRFILERLKIQEDTIKLLQMEIKDLKAQLAKDSHNSSKPPSSDVFKDKKKKTKSLRKKSGKKPGGQKGHEGKTLEAVDCPDKTKIHPVDRCKKCGESLQNIEATIHDKRQVFDLPAKIEIIVTEHQAEEKDCPYCGEYNKANFPVNITHKTQYGNHIKSIATYLSNYALIPYQRLSELFDCIFHVSISPATLLNINNTAGELLKETENHIKEKITNSEIVNFDETGSNIGGKNY
jgi:transposase